MFGQGTPTACPKTKIFALLGAIDWMNEKH
jgi:hypothetical protein